VTSFYKSAENQTQEMSIYFNQKAIKI